MPTRNQYGAGERQVHVLEILGNAIVGGMENYVRNLIQQIPPDQFRVTCLCPYESAFTAILREIGCDVFIAPMADDPPWRSIQAAVELIRHQGIDLVHAHLPNAHVLAGLAGCLTRTPVVATVHGMTITTQELGISRTTGTSLVVVCQAAYTQALAMGVPPERLTLIPNGVDTRTFVPDRSGDAFREAIGVPLDAPLVGFVGRLAPEKGPDHFVRAAERVHSRQPDVHFAVVGTGDIEDEVDALIKQLRLEDCVHLAGLWTNTWEVYPAFDILAQSSRAEGMPYVLLEAMACGCPVVAIAVGGVPEIVEVGTTGVLAGPGDWAGVGNAVLELLVRPQRLKQMGQAGRQRVEAHLHLSESVERMSELFRRLVNVEARHRTVWRSPWPAKVAAR
ncbi:MAG TPA: hypothetical protein DEP84_05680 [Chloroflexi bacterium]|nr:hypothetical protein [Chloroflexota bacterium]